MAFSEVEFPDVFEEAGLAGASDGEDEPAVGSVEAYPLPSSKPGDLQGHSSEWLLGLSLLRWRSVVFWMLLRVFVFGFDWCVGPFDFAYLCVLWVLWFRESCRFGFVESFMFLSWVFFACLGALFLSHGFLFLVSVRVVFRVLWLKRVKRWLLK